MDDPTDDAWGAPTGPSSDLSTSPLLGAPSDVRPELGWGRSIRPGDRRVAAVAAAALIVVAVVGGVLVAAGGDDTLGDARSSTTTMSDSADASVPRASPSIQRPPGTVPSDPSRRPRPKPSGPVTVTTATASEPEVTAPPLADEPAVVARPIPVEPPPPPPDAPPAPWASSVFTTAGGQVSTDVGCASDLSAAGLDAFFAERIGPVIGWDYQHVYPLGGGRSLWLFQDTFIDHSNTASSLGNAGFVHNSALVQDGNCFRLLHRGTTVRPEAFELGTGTQTLNTWFWPMGGEVHGGRLYVFWAEMRRDLPDPRPPDGLGWHPVATHLAAYDPLTMERLDFRRATSGGASPIYGYAVQSDSTYTYLFGNTFEQNLTREGGWSNGPHSGTKMFLARVPRGQLLDRPEYWNRDGWVTDRTQAHAFLQRHWSEFPMQPRYVDGQWVASAAVNGYWGDEYEIDVARDPWGPWTTIASGPLVPRGGDPAKNTYHAQLLPWRDASGNLIVSVSNNARDMLRDAWPHPERYRPTVFATPWGTAPDPAPPVTTTTVAPAATTTTSTTSTIPPTSSTTTTVSATTTSSTTTTSTSSTTSTTTSTTTTSTVPTTSTSSTSSTSSTTTVP